MGSGGVAFVGNQSGIDHKNVARREAFKVEEKEQEPITSSIRGTEFSVSHAIEQLPRDTK